MRKLLVAALAAIAYVALAALSYDIAYAEAHSDAGTAWLAAGLTLGVLCARPRREWPALLIGVVLGAAVFELWLEKGAVVNAIGYAAIEVLAGTAGAWIASRVAPRP